MSDSMSRRKNLINRRDFLRLAGYGVGGTLLATACSKIPGTAPAATIAPVQNSGAVKGAGEVIVCAWGGSSQEILRETVFNPFEEATGIKVIDTTEPDTAKIKAMVDTGNVEWDVVTFGLDYMGEIGEDYFVPIDYSIYPQEQLDGLYEKSKTKYAVGDQYFAIVSGYRTDVFPTGQHPKNWAEWWDVEKFPGPRSMHASGGIPTATFEMALLADGVSPKDLYPLDIDRALASLEKIKPSILKFWQTGAEASQLLTDKEVFLATHYNTRLTQLIDSGLPIAIEWNQGVLYQDLWFIIKNGPNTENAQKYIQYATMAETQARFVSKNAAGPTNAKAFDLIDPKRGELLPSNPKYVENMVFNNEQWWAENRADVAERFAAWLVK